MTVVSSGHCTIEDIISSPTSYLTGMTSDDICPNLID
jgi:hypothetical protein